MGDPKKPKKKYETPKFLWRADALNSELTLIGQYGLRNKREIWRHKTTLSNFRSNARSLLGITKGERQTLETQLLQKLQKMGILAETAVLDNVLDLSVEDILERRLQTIVFRKGLARSPHQARQLINHGHIVVNHKRVFSPGYLVPRDEESGIAYAPTSPLAETTHPIRVSISSMNDLKTETMIKEETK